jgi:lysophospholipase L1-like esterase
MKECFPANWEMEGILAIRSRGRSFTTALLACALAFAGGGCRHSTSSPTEPEIVEPPLLNIGSNDPNTLVAFGDSISDGFYSVNGKGYRDDLERLLRTSGRPKARVRDEADSGTFSSDGVERIHEVLRRDRPAVLILLYGTNDEHASLPRAARIATTSENLRTIIAAARANRTIVVLSTLPPVCLESRDFQEANIVEMNARIRVIGAELHAGDPGVLLADPWLAFMLQAPPDGCGLINLDSGNHPNEQGYGVLARTYFDALSSVRW